VAARPWHSARHAAYCIRQHSFWSLTTVTSGWLETILCRQFTAICEIVRNRTGRGVLYHRYESGNVITSRIQYFLVSRKDSKSLMVTYVCRTLSCFLRLAECRPVGFKSACSFIVFTHGYVYLSRLGREQCSCCESSPPTMPQHAPQDMFHDTPQHVSSRCPVLYVSRYVCVF
jgi:hypothetical protein